MIGLYPSSCVRQRRWTDERDYSEVHIVHPLRRRIEGKAGFRGLGDEGGKGEWLAYELPIDASLTSRPDALRFVAANISHTEPVHLRALLDVLEPWLAPPAVEATESVSVDLG